jgi:hypothetical protein
MKATLDDPVFGPLTWDDETQTYSGSAEFRPGQMVSLEIIVHNADELRPREVAAFLNCAREQWRRLRRDDALFRRHAAGLFLKAWRKASRPAVEAATVEERLTLLTVEIDNAGITLLRYGAHALWPRKRFTVAIDGSDRLV